MLLKHSKGLIHFITLGCSKNTVDSEVLMRQFQAAGYPVSFDSEISNAEAAIINTCGFITDAKKESIDVILQCIEAKKNGILKRIFVIGCLSQRYGGDLYKEMPEIDAFLGVQQYSELLSYFQLNLKSEILGERLLTSPSHYAYLKIAEGCDRNCSFCAIPGIRGKHQSKPIESLIEEAAHLTSKGVKELILVAQDTTYYGIDIYKKQKLAELMSKLSEVKGVDWIRLHYAYPASFPLDVLDVIADNPKICNYIDIPFQHINDEILTSMKRSYSKKNILDLIDKIRVKVANASIRTTLITGYPNETKKQFDELFEFVSAIKFDRLGVFTYSHEEDTPAFLLKDNVSPKTKENRKQLIMELQESISFDHNQKRIGQTLQVIIDREDTDFYYGRSEFDSPEIDNEIIISKLNYKLSVGGIFPIKILNADSFDLFG